MKKFLIHALIVIGIVAALDFTVGCILDKKCALYGCGPAKVALNNTYDIALMGASETQNQYITRIIADSLAMSAYNYGCGGQNIYFHYALLNMMVNHAPQKPKYIILDLQGIAFYDTPGWNTEKINALHPLYCQDDTLKSIVALEGWQTKMHIGSPAKFRV